MGLHKTEYKGLLGWIDQRMPTLMVEYKKHAAEYYAPKNFNFWYFFGSLALIVLVLQITTGIFLTMNYKPAAAEAFRPPSAQALAPPVDPKTAQQEVLQRRGRRVAYESVEETGPAHARRFRVVAIVDGDVLGEGEGASRRSAEQHAARRALHALGEQGA